MIKTFCLCLPEHPEKIESAKKHFAESGLENVEFFWGLHAETAGLSTEHPYERDAPGSGFRMGYKSTGTWMSHYMLWNALAHMDYDRVLILEDDVKCEPEWRERSDLAISQAPPDFDMLYLGNCCMEGFEKTLVSGDVYETKKVLCNHAYVLNRKCIPLLLRTMRKVWAPVDIQIQLECMPHLRVFAVMPRIFSQFGLQLAL